MARDPRGARGERHDLYALVRIAGLSSAQLSALLPELPIGAENNAASTAVIGCLPIPP